jgi:hypothetical protein
MEFTRLWIREKNITAPGKTGVFYCLPASIGLLQWHIFLHNSFVLLPLPDSIKLLFMSTTNERDNRRWFSLFDPKTGKALAAIEGGFEQDDEEGYEEGNLPDEDDDLTVKNEPDNESEELLVTYDDEDDED